MSAAGAKGWRAKCIEAFATSRWTIPLLLLAGVAIKLAWASRHLRPYTSEMHQIAVSLARTGVIADAYRVDGIPTTHVGPVAPIPGAIVYHLFGVDSRISEALLTLVVCLTIAATMVLLDRAFAILGQSPLVRRLGIAAFLFVPVDLETETRDFRIREGAYAACILAGILFALLRLDREEKVGWKPLVALSLLCAFLFLLSPSAAIPAYAACGVLALRKLRPLQWPLVLGLAGGVLVLASLPWAMRNQHALGQMVWSRGNVGLELAVGTYPGAVAPVDPVKEFTDRLDAIHPYKSDAAYRRMQAAGGELAYAKALGDQTWAWARQHPVDAARIWLRHVREFYFPPRWLWDAYGTGVTRAIGLRMAWTDFISLAALLMLGGALAAGRYLYFYPLAMIATAVLPYIVAQPRTRYHYPISGLVVFLGVAGILAALQWLDQRRGSAPATH